MSICSFDGARAGFVLNALALKARNDTEGYLAQFSDNAEFQTNSTKFGKQTTTTQTKQEKIAEIAGKSNREFQSISLHTTVTLTAGQDDGVVQSDVQQYLKTKMKNAKVIADAKTTQAWTIGQEQENLKATANSTEQVLNMKLLKDAQENPTPLTVDLTKRNIGVVQVMDIFDPSSIAEGVPFSDDGVSQQEIALVLSYWSGILSRNQAQVESTLDETIKGKVKAFQNESESQIEFNNKEEIVRSAMDVASNIERVKIASFKIFKDMENNLIVMYELSLTGTVDGQTVQSTSSGIQRWNVKVVDSNMLLSNYDAEQTDTLVINQTASSGWFSSIFGRVFGGSSSSTSSQSAPTDETDAETQLSKKGLCAIQ